jgi:hypothetical protein
MYVSGMRTPYSIGKIPAQQRVNLGSLKAWKSGHADFAFEAEARAAAGDSSFDVGDVDGERFVPRRTEVRLRRRRFAGMSTASKINPKIRILQASPREGSVRRSTKGKIMPPIPPALAAIPVASPRRTKK